MEKIVKMDPKEIASRPAVKALWDKGFFWSLAHRRVFKYLRGFDMPHDGFWDYKKVKEIVPLDEVETALLCWAAAGTTGLIRNDLPIEGVFTHQSFEGRTYPAGCNTWYDHLLFCNDDGVFHYTPHVPTKVVEIQTQDDVEVIFRAFKEGVTKLDLPPIREDQQGRLAHGQRGRAFKPGMTVFCPVVGLTIHTIHALLNNFNAPTPEQRMVFYDDIVKKPAGVQKWIDNGFLKGAETIPLSAFDAYLLGSVATAAGMQIQNLLVCQAAMGLGGAPLGGVNYVMLMGGTPTMRGLGFRWASDKRGYPYPVGIDGVFGAHLPPYMSIDEAVDDCVGMVVGPNGRYDPEVKEGQEVMYPGFSPKPRAVHRPFKDPDRYCKAVTANEVFSLEAIQACKDCCNYIYNTYGRIPVMGDPFFLPAVVQTFHMDPDLYDEYYVEGSIWQEQRDHLIIWHGMDE